MDVHSDYKRTMCLGYGCVDGLNHLAKWHAGWKSWQSIRIGSNTDPVRNAVMLTDSAAGRQMGVSNAKISSVGMVDPLTWTLKNSWEEGQLRSESLNEAVNNLHANPTLLRNVKELCRLQAILPGVVADQVRAKKQGRRPGEVEQRVKSAELKYFCDR